MENRIAKRLAWLLYASKPFAYMLQFVIFYALMAINNPQMIRLSRTSIVTAVTMTTLYVLLLRIYGGFDIGRKKSRAIIYSMSLSIWITDLATYLQLQIMNVNTANNEKLVLFGQDILFLLLACALQFLIVTMMAYGGNNLYFRMNPPKRCCIITTEHTDITRLLNKIGKFRLQYKVYEVVDYRIEDLHAVIRRHEMAFIYNVPFTERAQIVEYCYKHRRGVHYEPEIYDIVTISGEPRIIDDLMLVGNDCAGMTPLDRMKKRLFDLLLVIPCAVAASPVMLVCAMAVKLCDGGTILYKQRRMTDNARIFKILKFRTMKMHSGDEQQYSAQIEDDRITPVGRILRKLRFDELPQLINIIKGDMSFVGPRPEMLENIERYMETVPEFSYRSRMRAGLTGYAQIAGKYNTPPREKLLMDLYYIENYSMWLDFKLVLRTALVFFRPDSAEAFEADSHRDTRPV